MNGNGPNTLSAWKKAQRGGFTRRFSWPVLALVAAGLTAILVATSGASAADRRARAWQVRELNTGPLGVTEPVGLTYLPGSDRFLVVEEGKQGSRPVLRGMSIAGEERSGIDIPKKLWDPINTTYDRVASRLILMDGKARTLTEVKLGHPGNPLGVDSVTVTDIRHLGLRGAAGIASDPSTGRLAILDDLENRIAFLTPASDGSFANGSVNMVYLTELGRVKPRGLALHPTTGSIHILSPKAKELYETTEKGVLVATRDLSDIALTDPQGIAFGPTGDSTDDPSALNLYIADRRKANAQNKKAQPEPEGQIVEVSLSAAQVATDPFVADLVQTILTSQFDPPSPDSAGVSGFQGGLLITDSEVNEMPIFTGVNVFRSDLNGALLGTFSTTDYSNEPTGVAVNTTNGRIFISDDNKNAIFEISPGADGIFGSPDDRVVTFDTNTLSSSDPEGITYHQAENAVFIVDGVNNEVYRINLGPDGLLNGLPPVGDDSFSNFDTSTFATDPEGIAVNTDNGLLLVLSRPDDVIAEVSLNGTLVRSIDISNANPRNPAGLAYTTSSYDNAINSVYIVDRGVDNNSDPNENDGKLYEMSIAPFNGNFPPTVSAGPDQTTVLGSGALLNGTVSDDGLPDPPASLTTTWTTHSGPGSVNFANASDIDTTATFSTTGSYTLQLTANDGEHAPFDRTVVTVLSPGANLLNLQVDASSDDAEEDALGHVSRGSSDLELVFDDTNQTVGMRFNAVTIPQGSTIESAYLQFTVDEDDSEPTSLSIRAELTDNAGTFSSALFDLSNRLLTSSTVPWAPDPWTTVGVAGAAQRSPNLAAVIQEVVNRPGWSSGNSLALLITGTGKRVADSFNGNPLGAPALSLVFLLGDPGPTVTNLSPNNGPEAGATAVSISGSNFVNGATVLFGATAAASVTFVNASQLDVTTPAGTAGSVNVTVTNPDAQATTLPNGFTYNPAPSITNLTPNNGLEPGGTAVSISGSNFVDGATVTFGGTAASATFVNASQLDVTTPVGTSGSVNVTVTNPDTQATTLPNGFTYNPAPSITNLSPNNGSEAGGTTVTIAGANFLDGATVLFGATAATNVTFISASQLDVIAPAGTGPANVTVTNPDGGTTTLANAYTYDLSPSITTLNPNNGPEAGGTAVSISGSNFVDGATVSFGAAAATGVTFVNPTQLDVTTPAGAPGSVTVTVTNPDTQVATLPNGYSYNGAPSITNVTPDSGPETGGAAVSISGTNFVSGATVLFGATAASVTFVNATQLDVTTPAGAVGSVSITVTNPDTQATTFPNAYTFNPAPSITNLSPNNGPEAGGTVVSISGANFVSGATVLFGAAAAGVTFVNTTQLDVTTPAGSPGSVDVTVTNPDGGIATVGSGYTYDPAPSLTNLSPNNGPEAGDTAVSISGSNFVNGATVLFGATAATSVTFVNAGQLDVTTPAGAPGSVSVTVTNPDTQAAILPNAYSYNGAPSIANVSPNGGPATGGTAVTITGVNFVNGATVLFGTAPASVAFISANQLDVTAPAGTVGSVDVTVTNPDTQSITLPNGYTYSPSSTIALDLHVEASSDDAEEDPSGDVSRGSSDLELVSDGENQTVGLRFNAITIAKGSPIESAFLQFTVDENSINPTFLTIRAESTDDAQTFTSARFNITSRPLTTNSVAWAPDPWAVVGESGPAQRSPNLAPLIQEVVSRAGWNAGNSLVLVITGTGERVAESFDGAPLAPPALSIRYTPGPPTPSIGNLSPNNGPESGGTAVSITGSNFISGATVSFGSTAASSVIFVSPNQLDVTTPTGTPGLVNVTVTNPDTLSGTLTNGYTYNGAPSITSVSPDGGPETGGTPVTITGSNFIDGATVLFGGASGSVAFVNSTQLDVTAPPGTAGMVTVTVTNPDTQEATLSNGYTYTPSSATVLSIQVNASSDDAEEAALGKVSRGSSDLELVFDDTNQTVGIRFNGLTIPQGSTIESAFLQFTADEVDIGPTSLSIRAQSTDNAGTFTSAPFNISSRPVTGNAVAWAPEPWDTVGAAGPPQRSPNLAPVIQEIVNRPGWTLGNSIVFVITGTGERAADSFNGDPLTAPVLSVVFAAAP